MYRIEDCPEILANYYLSGRSRGSSLKLCGKVMIISCLLKRSEGEFDQRAVFQYFEELNRACEMLEREARRLDAELSFENRHFNIDLPPTVDPRKGFSLLKNFLTLKTTKQAKQYYGPRFGADETPFILVFDEWNRSFSWEQTKFNKRYVNEVSVIFRDQHAFSWRTIAHELLHQYGAVDFYFPDETQRCADACLGESIMGYHGERVDDLTAYLVGWTDILSDGAYRFLKETMWMTYERNMQEMSRTWEVDIFRGTK